MTMAGCVDLGLNTAYGRIGLSAFTRQMRPRWLKTGRTRQGWEPFPVWVDSFGFWAEGPLDLEASAHWEMAPVHVGMNDHPASYFASTHGACTHLTLAANCSLATDLSAIYLGRVYEFALRPYRWQEEEVQRAYAAVAEGLSAEDVASVDWVGEQGRTPTDDELKLVADIHRWDAAVAQYLAFGKKAVRPFAWLNGIWGDSDMAAPYTPAGYECHSMGLHGQGGMYRSYEEAQGSRSAKGDGGQGFFAWRRCDDGAPGADDWRRIGAALVQSGILRPRQAFDICVDKTVTLARGKWRSQGISKEVAKDYYIRCWRISGAPPAEEGTTRYAI